MRTIASGNSIQELIPGQPLLLIQEGHAPVLSLLSVTLLLGATALLSCCKSQPDSACLSRGISVNVLRAGAMGQGTCLTQALPFDRELRAAVP